MQEDVAPTTDSKKRSVGNVNNLKFFQKGVSGNPGGRKKTDDIRLLARKHTTTAFNRIIELIHSEDERVAFMAAKEVIDRAYGKPKPTEDDAEKHQLTINIVRYGDNPTAMIEHKPGPNVSIRTLEGETL